MQSAKAGQKLAAIVAVDIVGYSTLSERDPAAALAAVQTVQGAVSVLAARHNGRLFNRAGDGFMVEFASCLDAVRFGVSLLRRLRAGPLVRVGAHQGQVNEGLDGDLLGHAVNVAARLMGLAEPGGFLLSDTVGSPLPPRVRKLFKRQGPVLLTNMSDAVGVHALAGRVGLVGRLRLARRRPWALGLVGAGAALGVALALAPRVDEAPLVAVLPFEATDAAMAPVARGLADDIIVSLASAPGLRVAARTSSFAFTADTKHQAGRALRARYILDAELRQEDGQFVLRAQLADVRRNNMLVWSQEFRSAPGETSETERLVAEAVAVAVAGAGTGATTASSGPVPTDEALALYYAGREARLRRTVADLDQAVALLTRATALSPSFDRAFAELAGAQLILADRVAPAAAADLRAAALANAMEALSLNPANAYAMAVRAGLEPPQAWAARRAWLDRAAQIAPSDAVVRRARARILSQLGYMQAAQDELEEAAALDPRDAQLLLIWTREAMGRRQDARALLAQAAAANDPAAWNTRLLFALFDRDFAGANALLDARVRPMEIAAETVERFSATASGLQRRALRAEAIAAWRAAAAAEPALADDAFLMIAWLGDRDTAFAVAEAGMASMGQALVFPADLALAPAFRPILYDPRYMELMGHSGLLDYWRRSGMWPDFCADVRLPYRCT
jgi:class 3 adenylate cyclase/TolB-like protein